MTHKKIKINKLLFVFLLGLLVFNACKEDKDYPRTRLFQPVLNDDEGIIAKNNTLIVGLGDMKDVDHYIVEVSRDSFETVLYTFNVDTSYFIIDENVTGEELLWRTVYQIQVTAIAEDEKYNSLPSFLGSKRTEKYPSNQGVPGPYDATDTRARVFWANVGDDITRIVVYAAASIDERLTTPLFEVKVEVGDDQSTTIEQILSGLDPETEYQIAIYSGDEIRGWETYKTKEKEISGDNVINLFGITNADILADTLPDLGAGSILLLEGGMVYNTGGYAFDKSVEFRKGYSFTASLPVIECASNFNITSGATIDSIVFKEIRFVGEEGLGKYVFNINVAATIGELTFKNCEIHSLRGVTRMKDKGPGIIDTYTISGCVVDSVRDYGVCAVDHVDWTVNNFVIENSTFSKVQYFLISRSASSSVIVESCTFNEVPGTGAKMFRWRGVDGSNDVANGIKINNSVFGHGWDKDLADNTAVIGYEGLPNSGFFITNTYATKGFSFSSKAIPGFPSFTYDGSASDLWIDAYKELNFNINDSGFGGKSDCGDPRWRVTL